MGGREYRRAAAVIEAGAGAGICRIADVRAQERE
jgi:hypothetical protein